jgi:hypothetical protein
MVKYLSLYNGILILKYKWVLKATFVGDSPINLRSLHHKISPKNFKLSRLVQRILSKVQEFE